MGEALDDYKRGLRDAADGILRGELPADHGSRWEIAFALKHFADTVKPPSRPRGRPLEDKYSWVYLALAVERKRRASPEKRRGVLYGEVADEEQVNPKTVERAYVAMEEFVKGFNPR